MKVAALGSGRNGWVGAVGGRMDDPDIRVGVAGDEPRASSAEAPADTSILVGWLLLSAFNCPVEERSDPDSRIVAVANVRISRPPRGGVGLADPRM